MNATTLPSKGFIAGLKAEDRTLLASHGTFRSAKNHEILIEQGKSHGRLFFVLEGTFKAERRADGRATTLGTIGQGEWIGEIDLFDPSSAVCSVVAEGDADYWTIAREELEKFINASPKAGSALLIGLASTLGRRIRESTERAPVKAAPPLFPLLALGGVASACAVVAFLALSRPVEEPEPIVSQTEVVDSGDADRLRQRVRDLEQEVISLNAAIGEKNRSEAAARQELESLRHMPAIQPTPSPVLVAAPPPPQPLPEASPAPEATGEWPEETTLREQAQITIRKDGKVVGSMVLPAGRTLRVTGEKGSNALVSLAGGTAEVPKDKTDFIEALQKSKRQARQVPTVAATPLPAPTPRESRQVRNETLAPAEAVTFADINALFEAVDIREALLEFKPAAAAAKDAPAKAEPARYFKSQMPKWRAAESRARELMRRAEVPAPMAEWLKKFLLAAEMVEGERIDYLEAQLRQIDRDWLQLKTEDGLETGSRP